MKNWTILIITAVIAGMFIISCSDESSTEPTGNIINFPDHNLEQKVRDVINKPSGEIYSSDVENISSFKASGLNISDITGLKYFTNLTRLDIGDNDISDLSELSALTKLEILLCHKNQISDISVVEELPTLTELYAWNNMISSISSFINRANLRVLFLQNNPVTDIIDLKGLTSIEEINISGITVSDCGFISDFSKLEALYMENTGISDLSFTSDLKEIDILHISNNSVTDLAALVYNNGFGNLDIINLIGNPLNTSVTDNQILHLENRGITVYYNNKSKANSKVITFGMLDHTGAEYNETTIACVTFKAWMTGRDTEVLTETSQGCRTEHHFGLRGVSIVDLQGFTTPYQVGDELNVLMKDANDGLSAFEALAQYTLVDIDGTAYYLGFEDMGIAGSGLPWTIDIPGSIEDDNLPPETCICPIYVYPQDSNFIINFTLVAETNVKLTSLDFDGNLITTFVDGMMNAGYHQLTIENNTNSEGLYFIKLEANNMSYFSNFLIIK